MKDREIFLIKVYRNIIPENMRRNINEKFECIKTEQKNRKLMERKHFGKKNKDKVFYVIRTDSKQKWGICTTYMFVLNNIKYAVEHKWIPVVDYKNYYLATIQDIDKRGKENAWNYFFEDLVPEYSLDEVYESYNVILGPLRGQPYGSMDWSQDLKFYDDCYSEYFRLANKYIRFNETLINKAEEIYKKMFPQKEKVLGVTIRAGSYWGYITQHSTWKNHRKGKSLQECIHHITDDMKELNVHSFFLSCDDEYYTSIIKENFGDHCLYYNRVRHAFFKNNGMLNTKVEDIDGPVIKCGFTKQNLDYAIEVLLLSKCDYLLGINGGASVATHFIKGEPYEESIML